MRRDELATPTDIVLKVVCYKQQRKIDDGRTEKNELRTIVNASSWTVGNGSSFENLRLSTDKITLLNKTRLSNRI